MNAKTIIKSVIVVSMLMCSMMSYAKVDHNPTDKDINTSINTKLSADQSLAGTSITVKTVNGVANLSGSVDSDTQASAATELAQSTPYVKDVDTSDLTIKGSDHPVTDMIITAKIKGMFIQKKLYSEKDIAAMSIGVETNNGTVSLSGTANNKKQIQNAIIIAKSISGVTDVKSTVTVSPIKQ